MTHACRALLTAAFLLVAPSAFAAGTFDVDASGRDSIVFVQNGYPNPNLSKGWRLWAWKIDGTGTIVKDIPGQTLDTGPSIVVWCCASYMGDYDGDGYADIVDKFGSPLAFSMLYNRIEPLRDLKWSGASNRAIANIANDPIGAVSGHFVATNRDSMFTRVMAPSTGDPANYCMFNDWLLNSLRGILVACPNPPFLPAGAADIDGDGYADLFFRDDASGSNWVWYIRAGAIVGEQAWPGVDPAWKLASIGDSTGDGIADIVWQHTSGWLWRHRIQNKYIVADDDLGPLPPEWVVASSGDYDGDGIRDLLLRNAVTGELMVKFLGPSGIRSTALLPAPSDPNWNVLRAK
jgi:hypothetical protein